MRAWMPWLFLSVAVILWGLAPVKAILNGGTSMTAVLSPRVEVPLLHRTVFRDYPVVPARVDPARINEPAYRNSHAEAALFTRELAVGDRHGDPPCRAGDRAVPARAARDSSGAVAAMTLRRMRAPLATIMLMLSLGFVTRYGGTDATLGLAFTKTGALYPFFAALLGWLGVALTGSDTSSNVLFGSLQKITAQQLGFNPILIVTANSTGGVMGKMIDAQSIVVVDRGDGPGGRGRTNPAVRVLAQPRAGRDHGGDRDAAGVCVSVHDSSGTVVRSP